MGADPFSGKKLFPLHGVSFPSSEEIRSSYSEEISVWYTPYYTEEISWAIAPSNHVRPQCKWGQKPPEKTWVSTREEPGSFVTAGLTQVLAGSTQVKPRCEWVHKI